MSTTVQVDLGRRTYVVRIGTTLPASETIAGGKGARVLVVSDSNVDTLYGARVEVALARAGASISRAVVPAGEETKSQPFVGQLYEKAVLAGLDRGSFIVALGGGMIGDLAGFVAATYLRGIRCVQMPTTLLAMVDSSVGGKTGINLPQGKNLVGAFHQPVEVCADLSTLASLPTREYVSGLAEVVKYGIISDAALFARLERDAAKLAKRDLGVLEDVVTRCCEIKAGVVSSDEEEGGSRAILNLGHTLAHALENRLGYGRLLHGEAVSVGLVFACRLSAALRGFAQDDCRRVEKLLAQFGLPVHRGSLPDLAAAGKDMPWPELRKSMGTDKKTLNQALRFVLTERLGHAVFGCEVAEESLARTWAGLNTGTALG